MKKLSSPGKIVLKTSISNSGDSRRSGTIRKKLLYLLLGILIPVLLIQALIYYDRFQTRREREVESNLELARASNKTFGMFISDIWHQELALGLTFTLKKELSQQEINCILKMSKAEYPGVDYIHWIDPMGIIRGSTEKLVVGRSRAQRDYYQAALSGQAHFLTDFYKSAVTGNTVFAVSRSIRNNKGGLQGIVVAAISSGHLDSFLGIGLGSSSAITVIDRHGSGFYRYPKVLWQPEDVSILRNIRTELTGKKEITAKAIGLDGKERFIAATHVGGTGWIIMASRSEYEVYRPVMQQLVYHGFLTLFATLGFFAAAFVVSGRWARRVEEFRAQITAFGKEGKHAPVQTYGLAELEDLASAFNAMSQEIIRHVQELDRLRNRNELILNSAGDGIFGLDRQGITVFLNHAASKMLGYEINELIGKSFHELTHHTKVDGSPYPVEDCPICAAYKDGSTHSVSGELFWRKDGSSFPVEYTSTPVLQNQEPAGAVVIFKDITERKRMEDYLLRAQKIESVGMLAGGIAHEFNNVLTGVLGNISLAKLNADARTAEYLDSAEDATLRARSLASQFLTFAKGGLPVRKRILSIGILVKEAAEFAAQGSHIKCRFDIAKNLRPVEVDEGQVSQAISNLVLNAVQAMPGGGTLTVRVQNVSIGDAGHPPLLKPGYYIQISIQDQGEGIPKELFDKIFDPFFTTREEGRGLGLAITHSIIEKHGGIITVESEIGVGSTFTVYLPALSAQKGTEVDTNENELQSSLS